ncbi:MAG: DMT family transporter [Clostridiaceae bacterium]|nr:DMT family transporter [Clostridiaceae bacterium]
MQKSELKASILLTLAAAIWGFAFVAQRVGIQHIGSFVFTGIRFALGAFSLMPVIWYTNRKKNITKGNKSYPRKGMRTAVLKAGVVTGIVLFAAVTLQQFGLKDTTAGKAAFITGFYIILVPVFGVFFNQKTNTKTWIAAVLAIIGLYLISVNENLYIAKGDLLVFACSFFFAAHILLINKYTQYLDALELSFVQYFVCSLISMIMAILFEDIAIFSILKAAIPILYGGIFSVGVAYTLQAYGQKYAKASHAAIIMSLESVFAVIGGTLLLKESMSLRGYAGCLLMLLSVIISQYKGQDQESKAVGSEVVTTPFDSFNNSPT